LSEILFVLLFTHPLNYSFCILLVGKIVWSE